MNNKAFIKGEEFVTKESDMLEQIVRKCSETPEKIAVCSEYGCVTYGELLINIKKIVSIFEKNGIGKNSVVAVIADRKPAAIMMILAIVYMGACYLPIEKKCPEKRALYMMQETGAEYLVYEKGSDNAVLSCGKRICIDLSELGDIISSDIKNFDRKEMQTYIIFTSGTTGRPKGVSVKIEQIQNLCEWYINEHGINENSNILLINSMSFDASVKNIFSPLMVGGTLVLGSENLFDTEKVLDIIEKYHVTHLNCVQSLFAALVETDSYKNFSTLEKLEYIVLGGERFNKPLIKKFISSSHFNGFITNVYGPTECTVISSEYKLTKQDFDDDREIPIGKPVYNMNAYILNDNRQFCNIGEEGTLYLSGIGTACYCTSDSGDGFVQDILNPSEVMYNTNDVAKINENEEIEFIGRKDSQVKIRGYRIELNEIENIIKEFQNVSDAVVFVSDNRTSQKYITAAIRPDKINEIDLKQYLESYLPEYMIPNKFIFCKEFPVTVNGKTDINALKEMALNDIKNNSVSVSVNLDDNTVAKKIIDIWKSLLKTENFGVDDRFFDVGGHSLLLFKMMKMIEKELHVNISITDIMSNSTVSQLTNFITNNKKVEKDCTEISERVERRTEFLKKRMGR
jgi:amino acid adenylation domain-containing protein